MASQDLVISGMELPGVWLLMFFYCGVIAFSLIFILKKRSWYNGIVEKYDGKLIEYVRSPTPADSLVRSLERMNIKLEEVRRAVLLSQEAPNQYLESSELIEGMTNANILVVGYSATSFNEHNSCPSRIHYRRASSMVTEHPNLLETEDGRHFVWYEPVHEVVDEIHLMPQGAFLIQVPEEAAKKVEHEINALVESPSDGAVVESTLIGGVPARARESVLVRT